MALRWSAVAFVETEKNYRRITGYPWIATQRCNRSVTFACAEYLVAFRHPSQ